MQKTNKWKEDTLRLKAISDNSIKCKCGHSIFTSDKEIICRWCGRKVYRPKEEFIMHLKRALERKCI